MDRLLQLTSDHKGGRRNDPRFHVGWQHIGTALQQAKERVTHDTDTIARRHFDAAKKALSGMQKKPHPKIEAVAKAIWPVVESGEKVLVFCHHRATAGELLSTLDRFLKRDDLSKIGPPEAVWRAAWNSLLSNNDPLLPPIIDWLCSSGLRRQIASWLVEPDGNAQALAHQLESVRPRNASPRVPTICESARALTAALIDKESKSTRSILNVIGKAKITFGGQASHFPGRLDSGYRSMGSWDHDGCVSPPLTLYAGQPDIVLAIFNSPFGPDVLVATDRLSEGVDLHRCCRHLIHYELDPSPVRTLQRNGRVRRFGSWAALTEKPICYAYPTFSGTRDEKAVGIMKQRINAFGLLLGGVPPLDDEAVDSAQSFAEEVMQGARKRLKKLNGQLCDF